MKLIFSRKGFDSSSGGVPSPIFPDDQMLSLPIPDKSSTLSYKEIAGNSWATVGELVEQLAAIPQAHRAHLDPDLAARSLPRARHRRPIFGQGGKAQSHLNNQGVGPGDLFLFFGLFRSVEKSGSGWQYLRASRPMHILFGWLQVAQRIDVAKWPMTDQWALYHPHLARKPRPGDMMYVATSRLVLPRMGHAGVAGAGTFSSFSPGLRLTAPDSSRHGLWRLPQWFHPAGRDSEFSYHGDKSRWIRTDAGVTLSSVGRGQEFVLDCNDYPEALPWLRRLLRNATAKNRY